MFFFDSSYFAHHDRRARHRRHRAVLRELGVPQVVAGAARDRQDRRARSRARCSTRRACSDVQIRPIGGQLTDNYDPRVARAATSRRACTTAEASRPPASPRTRPGTRCSTPARSRRPRCARRWCPRRTSARRARGSSSCSASSRASPGSSRIGAALFGLAVLFQIVTLPVEFDASRRAMASLEREPVPAARAGRRRAQRADGRRDDLRRRDARVRDVPAVLPRPRPKAVRTGTGSR